MKKLSKSAVVVVTTMKRLLSMEVVKVIIIMRKLMRNGRFILLREMKVKDLFMCQTMMIM